MVLVRDLDAAAADYERLGFTVAPQMRHTGFGTANRIVLFANNFIELVGIVAPDELAGPGFLIRDRLASHGPGAFGIALNSGDIARDRARLAASGLVVGEIGGGSRPVPLPDGSTGLARFNTVMIGGPREMPFVLFMSQQHVPDVVWIEEWQRHSNGAADLTGVTVAATRPAVFLPLLKALCGEDGIEVSATGLSAQLPLGRFEIISDAAAASDYGLPANGETSRIIATSVAANKSRRRIPAEKACGIILDIGRV